MKFFPYSRWHLPQKNCLVYKLYYICEQEILKTNFFSKNKKFRNALLEYIPALVISFLLYNNVIHKVWVNLITERQNKSQNFLGKISESCGTNLSCWGQRVLPETYNYLNPTNFLDLCCFVVQYIPLDCGSIAVV